MPELSEIPDKIWSELKSNPKMIIFIGIGAAIFGSVVPQEVWGSVFVVGGIGVTMYLVLREMKKHNRGENE